MRHSMFAAAILLTLGAASGFAAEDGLVGYWRFDTATGAVADRSGHGHTAQLSNGRTVVVTVVNGQGQSWLVDDVEPDVGN